MTMATAQTEPATKFNALPCKAETLFKIGDETPADYIAQLDSYFGAFAQPVHNDDGKRVCLNCGGVMDSFMQALGVGVAAQWTIAHGEACCSGCHWPMRGMHYVKDADGSELLTLRNFFLAYMPEHVERATPA